MSGGTKAGYEVEVVQLGSRHRRSSLFAAVDHDCLFTTDHKNAELDLIFGVNVLALHPYRASRL